MKKRNFNNYEKNLKRKDRFRNYRGFRSKLEGRSEMIGLIGCIKLRLLQEQKMKKHLRITYWGRNVWMIFSINVVKEQRL
jgi:hypothetical protein